MDTITQHLGFDASQAINAIQSLNSAMTKMASGAQSLGSSLNAFNAQGAQFSATMQRIANDASRAAAAMSKLGSMPKVQAPPRGLVDPYGNALSSGTSAAVAAQLTQVQTAAAGAATGVQKVSLTWETLGRVVATQAIVRAMSAVRNAIRDSTTAAIDFDKRVAEIGTIAPDEFGGSEGIAAKVKQIAKDFNQPLPKVSEAMYETISNGFDKAADAERVLTASSKLAAAAVTSTDQALNAITGVLNGFGLSSDQAGAAAGKFFETVRLGRLRVDDLANTIGRVAAPARQLGISVDEVFASVATSTLSGTSVSESLTQLRGAMNALAKPTEAMKAALKSLGFDSAEEGVAVKGFGGLLSALAKTTDGTSASFKELFPNIRGVNLAIQVGQTDTARYVSFLNQIKKANEDLATSKANQVLSSPGQQFSSMLNRAEIDLTTKFGAAIVQTGAKIQSFVDPVALVSNELSALSGPLATGATLLTAYGAAALAASAKNKLFGASIPGVVTTLVGASAAYTLGGMIGDKITEYAHSGVTAIEQANALELASVEATQKKMVEAQQNATQKHVESVLAGAQDIYRAYQKEADAASEANDKLASSTHDAAGRIVSAREQLVSALGKAINDNEGLTKSSQRRVFDTMGHAQDLAFSSYAAQYKSNPTKQISLQLERAKQLAAQAQQQLASAGNAEEEQRALATFERAKKFHEAGSQGADKLGNSFLLGAAGKTGIEIANRQIAAEKQLQSLSAGRAAGLERERVAQTKILDNVKNAVKTLGENSNPLDENGQLLSDDKLKAQAAARAKAYKTLTDSAMSSKNFDLTKALDLAKLQTSLSQTPLTLRFDVERGIADVKAKMQAAFKNLKLNFPGVDVAGLEKALGKEFRTPTEVAQGIQAAGKELARLQGEAGKGPVNQKAIENLRGELQAIQTESEGVGRSISRWLTTPIGSGAGKAFDSFRADFANVAKSANVTGADITRLSTSLRRVTQLQGSGVRMGSIGPAQRLDLQNYTKGLQKLQQLQLLQRQQKTAPQTGAQIQRLQSALGGQASEQADRLSQALQRGATSVNAFSRLPAAMQEGASSAQRIASAFQAAAEAAQSTAEAAASISAPATGGAAHKAFGGPVYLASGGQPRGIDTRPAWLSAGEFVVNARSTRRFLPALQAMNAGLVPGHHAFGGQVTNTNVGDIHVHADRTPALTAQAIHSIISRGQRRGISK